MPIMSFEKYFFFFSLFKLVLKAFFFDNYINSELKNSKKIHPKYLKFEYKINYAVNIFKIF